MKANPIKRFCVIRQPNGMLRFYIAGEIVAECPIKAVSRIRPVNQSDTLEQAQTKRTESTIDANIGITYAITRGGNKNETD